MTHCDIVLVYIRDGVFGELEAIRGPLTMHHPPPQKPLAPPEPSTISTQDSSAEPNTTEPDQSKLSQHTSITQSTTVIVTSTDDTNVTPESASVPHAVEHVQPQPLALGIARALKTSVIIPESAEGE